MNGYTRISINGEAIGLKFSMPAIGKIQALGGGLDLTSTETMVTLGMAIIIYAGYWNNCLLKNIIPKHDLEFFSDAIDDAFLAGEEALQQYQDAMTVFNESKFIKQKLGEKEDDKKKAEENGPGTKLSPSVTGSLVSNQTIITD